MTPTLLYFGSFNPIHRGHMAIAEYVLANDYGQQLWFVISPQNPFKALGGLASEYDRSAMVRIAIEESRYADRMRACEIEFTLPRPSYTAATLRQLTANFPDRKFALLMGGDNLVGLPRWRESEWICQNFDIYVYPRIRAEFLDIPDRNGVRVLREAPLWNLDATTIRESAAADQYDTEKLSLAVINYLKQHSVYGK